MFIIAHCSVCVVDKLTSTVKYPQPHPLKGKGKSLGHYGKSQPQSSGNAKFITTQRMLLCGLVNDLLVHLASPVHLPQGLALT